MKKEELWKSKLFLIFIFMIISSFNSFADSGISPAKTTINFVPNIEYELHLKLYGFNEISYESNCPGELRVKDTYPENDYLMFKATLTMPEALPLPGKNKCGIRFTEKKIVNRGGISTQTGIGETIIINVPYPGRYATIDLSAHNVNQGETLFFKVTLANLGEEVLEDIKADIKIFDIEGKLIDLVSSNKGILERFESVNLIIPWETKNFKAARYKAIATLDYNGEDSATDEKEFLIGKIFVEFKNATRKGEPYEINPFDITVESWWGNIIKNVYAEVSIKNGSGIDVGKFKTISINLEPWKQDTLKGFWNAAEWGPSNYTANITINYEGGKTDATWNFELVQPTKEKISFDYLAKSTKKILLNPIFLLIVIALIVIIDIIWLTKKRKKRKKKNAKK